MCNCRIKIVLNFIHLNKIAVKTQHHVNVLQRNNKFTGENRYIFEGASTNSKC